MESNHWNLTYFISTFDEYCGIATVYQSCLPGYCNGAQDGTQVQPWKLTYNTAFAMVKTWYTLW